MTKEAMISPQEERQYQSGWDDSTTPPSPIYVYGWRVAQVVPLGQTFPMAEPIFWMECSDDVEQDLYYYDTTQNEILPVPQLPIIAASNLEQPPTSGLQTL